MTVNMSKSNSHGHNFPNKERKGLQKVENVPNFEILCVRMPLSMFYCAI